MQQKRLDYLDMAKGIGIFLVILGHIEYIQEDTLKWISSFHMPLFFVVGGILARLKQGEKRSVFQSIESRVRGVLTPYLSFSLMLLTMNTITHLLNSEALSGAALARQYVDTFTGYGVHILWFLPAYFIAGTLFAVLTGTCKEWQRNFLIVLLAAGAYGISAGLGLDRYVTWECTLSGYLGYDILITVLRGVLAMPFLVMGWYMTRLPKGWPALLLIPESLLALRAPVFDLHYLYVHPVHYLNAFLCCAGLIALVKALPVSRVLSWLGRNSLVIMCTHATFLVVYYVSLGMFFVKKWMPMSQPAFNLGVAILVCAAEVPIAWIFNRWFGRLIGRSSK